MNLNLTKTLILSILIVLLNGLRISACPAIPEWGQDSPAKAICGDADKMVYIGEIKGKSYIKMTICPANGKTIDNNLIVYSYKGCYYEAISGKTYPLVGKFDTGTHIWHIKRINNRNRTISIFSGKESRDGEITGTWKNKEGIFNFYLKRENSAVL